MPLHAKLFTLAQEMIDCYGPEAEHHAGEMLRVRLEEGDLLAAGVWLAIGNAIEDLEQLPPPGRRH